MAKKQDQFSNMQMPPLWTGVAGQGNQKIYSLGGKWHSAGTTLPSGYKIIGDDGKGTLKMSWNGLPVNVAMQGSTIQPYTPPAMPTAPAWMGGGAMSTADEEQMKAFGISGMEPSDMFKAYHVIDRTGIDEFINKMKAEAPDVNFGTLDDFQRATPAERKKGFRVWNNTTGDFTDFFNE